MPGDRVVNTTGSGEARLQDGPGDALSRTNVVFMITRQNKADRVLVNQGKGSRRDVTSTLPTHFPTSLSLVFVFPFHLEAASNEGEGLSDAKSGSSLHEITTGEI